MKRLQIAALGALMTALVTSGFGCELIASVDRTKIEQGGGGAGGTPTGGGGTGGLPTGGGGTGGTPTGGGGTGGGPICTTPADCDPPANECLEATCDKGVCGTAPKASGTPAAMQMPGDCKQAVCDGAGAITSENDDADLPDDGNECTDDACDMGTPSNTPVAEDSPCGMNGMLHCNAVGMCVDCIDATDCGTDTECQTFACDAMGVCSTMNAPQGTALMTQTDGDCQVEQCDGLGGTEMAEDNADVPVDATVCTEDVCTAGVPSNPPAMANAVCAEGAGKLCDGNGACVECLLPSDCAGMDTECQTRTCDMGVCGFDFTAAGTPLMAQTAGNCQVAVCDGAGGVTSADDDTDLPNDNNPCTDDTCSAGAPTFTNLGSGTSCGGVQVCDGNGQCVGCVVADDCPGTDDECKVRTCNANVCGLNLTAAGTPLSMQTPNDCKVSICDGNGNIVVLNDDADLPADDGDDCTDQACSNGTPAFPDSAINTPCAQGGGSFCDGAGACVECNGAAQCAAGNECQIATCTANTCGLANQMAGFVTPTQTAGDCQVNQCDGNGNVVQAESNGDVPVDGLECTGDVCTAGVPSNPPLAADSPCGPGGASFCDGGTACVECNVPSQCTGMDTECQTRTCAAHTCGFSFTAAGTPVAMQTAGDCQVNQCDGSGNTVSANLDTDVPNDMNECTDDVCTSGVPSNPNLPAGTMCTQNGGTSCDGSGACVSASCMDSTQNGMETDVDCGGGACPKCADGKMCAAGSDCQSSVCTGGVCQAASCVDGVKNGTETDVDCGGGACPACANGKVCGGNGDCTSGVCNGGTCVECVTAAQCPAGNECKTATCNANVCGFSFTAAGTVASSQTAGDCQENQCDGAGNTVAVADDADLPDDGQECTDDVCTAGVPSNPPMAVDTACSQGGGAVCDGTGACVQCNSAAQCPAGDECKTATCNANVCGFSFTAAGTVASSQTTGDCTENQCDGAGNTVAVADDADLPVDGQECTDDVCTAGVPSNPALPQGTTCSQNGGTICDGSGMCVTAPTVVGTTPSDGAGNVLTPTSVAVAFSTAMNPATLTGQTAAGACSGSIQVSYDGFASCVSFSASAATMSGSNTIATLTPSPALSVGKTYKIKVTTAAASAAGTPLTADYVAVTGFGTAALPAACTGSVVISQVYGAGGNSGAVYKNDFIELYNGGTTAVDVSGWAVHYAGSTGTNWSKTNLTGSIPPGGYYLVKEAGGANGADLPAADATGSLSMSASAGKVVLTNTQNAIVAGTVCPSGAEIVDVVGFGSATNCFEGTAPTANLSTTASASRKGYGCTDTADTSADMVVGLVNPRNSQNRIAANESNLGVELDYCVLQFPTSFSVATGVASPTIYGRIYEAGVTPGAGAGAGVSAQIGYGPVTANPQVEGGWTWVDATYNAGFVDASNEEYQASFTAPAAGTYRYTARFTLNNGGWTYCDLDATAGGGDAGAGSNAGLDFQLTQLGTMTVTP